MSAEIWVALIAAIGSVVGVVITTIWGNKKNAATAEQNKEVLLYRIDQLEKKQDKHNSLIERVFKLEKQTAVIEEEIDGVRQHIEDLQGHK